MIDNLRGPCSYICVYQQQKQSIPKEINITGHTYSEYMRKTSLSILPYATVARPSSRKRELYIRYNTDSVRAENSSCYKGTGEKSLEIDYVESLRLENQS